MKERVIQIDQNKVELKVILDEVTEEKLKRAKELVRTETIAELLDKALTALIEREEKKLGKTERPHPSTSSEKPHSSKPTLPATFRKASNPHSRYIPVQFKKIIFNRSQGQCEYVDRASKRRCESKAHLEIDHIKPIALNGKTKINNLRHLCRNHNLRASMEYGYRRFGDEILYFKTRR